VTSGEESLRQTAGLKRGNRAPEKVFSLVDACGRLWTLVKRQLSDVITRRVCDFKARSSF
jgi:hypothetical protein